MFGDGGGARPAAPLDLGVPRRIHVVGIGGSGMSAIAEVLAAMGHRVSGTDRVWSPVLDRLQGLGIAARAGHAAENLPTDAEVLVVSTAVPSDNPEVQAAAARGVPVLRRAEMLTAIAATRRTVAVAGTHGKTTTSAMLALVLDRAGLRPSFVVGGTIGGLGTGARWDDGPWLVVEADESDATFLELPAEVAVVTSVEPDHLDRYGGFPALIAAFERFVAGATGARLVCADDPVAADVGRRLGAATYGTADDADWRMVDLRTGPDGSRFVLEHEGVRLGELVVPMAGRHNALNATAAAATAMELGAPFDAVADALAGFPGVARRFERRGEAGGVTYVDDYGHLPAEVATVLAAARTGGWRRVVCVFQPHRFSRTAALWRDFASAFDDADVLVVTDVYPAGEQPRPGVTGKLVVDAVLEAHPSKPVAWLPGRPELAAFLRRRLRPGDLCITVGAGDLTTLPDELLGPSPAA